MRSEIIIPFLLQVIYKRCAQSHMAARIAHFLWVGPVLNAFIGLSATTYATGKEIFVFTYFTGFGHSK